MSDEKAPRKNYFKVVLGGFLGLCTGAIAMYFNAIFNQVIRPTKPVANFSIGTTDGLNVTLKNMASGTTGWWDFGDGTPLEPFDSEKQDVIHAYPKPGSYKVNLTVRNFLMEENDRGVTVEVAGVAANPNVLPPSITKWNVQPIDPKVPATYRVTGEIQNADEVIWHHNGKTEQLTAQPGPFDRYVRMDQAGDQPIMLTALSKTKKDPQVIVQTVSVQARKEAVYEAVLTVTDSVVRVEKIPLRESFPAPIRDQKGATTKGFSRVIQASPNSTLLSVELDKSAKPAIRRDRFKVEVAKDRKSATITGEWGASGDALVKEAGGGDMQVPLLVVEERLTQLSPTRSQMSGVLDSQQRIVIKLPPAPSPSVKREMQIDLGYLTPDGKRQPVVSGVVDPTGSWTGRANGLAKTVKAVTTAGNMVISFQ